MCELSQLTPSLCASDLCSFYMGKRKHIVNGMRAENEKMEWADILIYLEMIKMRMINE